MSSALLNDRSSDKHQTAIMTYLLDIFRIMRTAEYTDDERNKLIMMILTNIERRHHLMTGKITSKQYIWDAKSCELPIEFG
jgi:hypothetical protein